MTKIEDVIQSKLDKALNPTLLNVVNESYLHAGHAGDDGSGESHFRVEISSHNFSGKTRVAKQREIFDILAAEIKIIHALSIKII